jgi:hypothetical protein
MVVIGKKRKEVKQHKKKGQKKEKIASEIMNDGITF